MMGDKSFTQSIENVKQFLADVEEEWKLGYSLNWGDTSQLLEIAHAFVTLAEKVDKKLSMIEDDSK